MISVWKVIFTICLCFVIATDANRARRLRRQQPQQSLSNSNAQPEARQQPLPPNPAILNSPDVSSRQQQFGQNNLGGAQAGRQYYPNQGSNLMQGSYYPSGNMGAGYQQYGQGGQYGQYGQYGLSGQYGSPYGQSNAYYNQNPGYNSFYSGYNNRPGYSSNYNPSYMGSSGGYFWNGAQKQNINFITVLLSSLITLAVCFLMI